METMGFFRVAMWAITFATLLMNIALGIILGYHWKRHASDTAVASKAIATFIIVSGILLLFLFAATPAF